MRRVFLFTCSFALCAAVLFLLRGASAARDREDLLWHYRNLGKAFYENPTTQKEAVTEFKKALDLAPDSARERINYGLALLRAGQTKDGVAELTQAQKRDPSIPHTWFNLGIAFKKEGDYEPAIQQLEGMAKLVPDEPVTHYNLGVLYRLAGKPKEGLEQLEIAEKLNPNLSGPHFQLFNQYRQAGRVDEAQRELKIFQQIKARTAGAATPEDMEWSYYAEIFETVEPQPADAPPVPLKFEDHKLEGRFDSATAGLAALDFDGDGKADLIAWSSEGVRLYKNGATLTAKSGLEELKNVHGIAPGDFDNDGLPDLCVLTDGGPLLYHNNKGVFERREAPLPAGFFEKAIWMDYDHDGDLDLILLGARSVLMRNNGEAGFSNQTADFPFLSGHAVAAAVFAVRHDTPASDLAVAYRDHTGVIYRDRLNGRYDALRKSEIPEAASDLTAVDFNNDGFPDLSVFLGPGVSLIENHLGILTPEAKLVGDGPAVFADLENRGVLDLASMREVDHNRGEGKFERQNWPRGMVLGPAIVAADFDGDGRTDLATITTDGALHVYENQTETKNNWMRVGIAGIKNLKLAPGATVEIKAGLSYQMQIYEGLPLMFGLGGYKEADTVR